MRNFLLFFFFITQVKAQHHITIQTPAPYASYLLYTTTFKHSGIADSTGAIRLTVSAGSYTLELSAIGYNSWKQVLVIDSDRTFNISLTQQVKDLQEVRIQGRLPTVTRQLDRYVVNLEGSPLLAGQSAWDALQYGPGIQTNANGSISVNGVSGVTIMIGNKVLRLSGDQLQQFMSSLSAEEIKSMEIIPHPGAAFDAEGAGGVIKINLSKKKNDGVAGNVGTTVRQGVYGKYQSFAGLTYQKRKFSLFGRYTTGDTEGFRSLNAIRGTKGSELKQYSDTYNRSRRKTNQVRIGGEFELAKHHTFGWEASGIFSHANTTLSGIKTVVQDTTVLATQPGRNNDINYSANINYEWVIDTNGRQLTVIADYLSPANVSHTGYYNNYYTGNEQMGYLNRNGIIDRKMEIYTAQADLKLRKLSIGAKVSTVNSRNYNDFSLYDSTSGHWNNDASQTNHFRYKETIYAGYANYTSSYKKLEYALGLRLEQTEGTSHSLTLGRNYSRSYLKLFPSAHIKYQHFSLGISRRISRPAYDIMNPFSYYIDQYTIKQGNPYLLPAFTIGTEVTWTFNPDLYVSLNHYRGKNKISDVELRSGEYTIVTFATLDKTTGSSAGVDWSFSPAKWWSASAYFSVGYDTYRDSAYSRNNLYAEVYINNQLTLSKTTTAQVMFRYVSPGNDRFYRADYDYAIMNIGVVQKIYHDKISLRAGVNDLLYREGNVKMSNTYLQQNNVTISKWDSRTAYLGITYNFKKGVKVRQVESKKSNEAESQRAN